jgi:hypothetical protein
MPRSRDLWMLGYLFAFSLRFPIGYQRGPGRGAHTFGHRRPHLPPTRPNPNPSSGGHSVWGEQRSKYREKAVDRLMSPCKNSQEWHGCDQARVKWQSGNRLGDGDDMGGGGTVKQEGGSRQSNRGGRRQDPASVYLAIHVHACVDVINRPRIVLIVILPKVSVRSPENGISQRFSGVQSRDIAKALSCLHL